MILCTHEEIAVALANGYARATGEIMATGLHNVVGLQHASMAIFNAWCDRTPILNLGGGGPQNTINRRSTDWVHTALVQGLAVREHVKFDDQPATVDAVPESFLKAYRIAMTEPRGPVYVCLDTDVQEAKITAPMIVPDARLFRPPAGPAANPESLQRAAQLLAAADWPVIVAGELARNPKAVPPLLDIAELLGAAVIDADGRYGFPSTHPLNLTNAREEALQDADVVLALDVPSLGVPLGPSVRERGNFAPAVKPSTKIIHITLARPRTPELGQRQYVAIASDGAHRGGYGGSVAAPSGATARSVERRSEHRPARPSTALESRNDIHGGAQEEPGVDRENLG